MKPTVCLVTFLSLSALLGSVLAEDVLIENRTRINRPIPQYPSWIKAKRGSTHVRTSSCAADKEATSLQVVREHRRPNGLIEFEYRSSVSKVSLGSVVAVGNQVAEVIEHHLNGSTRLRLLQDEKHVKMSSGLGDGHIAYLNGVFAIERSPHTVGSVRHLLCVEEIAAQSDGRTTFAGAIHETPKLGELPFDPQQLVRVAVGDTIKIGKTRFKVLDIVPKDDKTGVIGWVSLDPIEDD